MIPDTQTLLAHLTNPGNTPEALLLNLRALAKQRDAGELIMGGFLGSGQDPLEVLDPVANTLGVLFMLSARLVLPSPPPVNIQVITNFCYSFEPTEARYAPERVTLLARGILRLAESLNSTKSAIPLLSVLLTRYPPSLSYLTTIHPIFLQACVMTSHFTQALPVLQVSITEVDKSISDIEYNDNLLYHYFGGVAFTALKKYREAEDFFEIVVSSPAQTASALQLEAYKKLTLVQLILHGKPKPPPKYTHPALPRLLKNIPGYISLLKQYPAPCASFAPLLEKEGPNFTGEGNMGLLNQALEHAPRWTLKKLTETYLTLSLAEIGQAIGFTNEDDIEVREISASLSSTGTLTFLDDQPTLGAEEVHKFLRDAQDMSRVLGGLDRQLGSSKEFLGKALKDKDSGASFVGGEDTEMWGAGAAPGGSAGGQWWDE